MDPQVANAVHRPSDQKSKPIRVWQPPVGESLQRVGTRYGVGIMYSRIGQLSMTAGGHNVGVGRSFRAILHSTEATGSCEMGVAGPLDPQAHSCSVEQPVSPDPLVAPQTRDCRSNRVATQKFVLRITLVLHSGPGSCHSPRKRRRTRLCVSREKRFLHQQRNRSNLCTEYFTEYRSPIS